MRALRSAKPKDVHTLTTEIQRLRVLVMLTRELDTGAVEAGAYKEMGLLNKLLAGQTFGEASGEETQRQTQIETAKQKLEGHGIKAENIAGIVRALEAITSKPLPEAPDDGDPEPTAPLELAEPQPIA